MMGSTSITDTSTGGCSEKPPVTMNSNVTPVRFSTRVQRKTLKAQESADFELQYAKIYSLSSSRMSKKVNESDILDTETISPDNQPGRSREKKQKTQDTKGIAEASGTARILRSRAAPSVFYTKITAKGKIKDDKSGVLPGIPGTEAPAMNAREDRAMRETTGYMYASVHPTTPYPVQNESCVQQEESPYQHHQDSSVYQQPIAFGIEPDPSMESEKLWEDSDGFLFQE